MAIISSCSGSADESKLNVDFLPIQLEKDGYWSFVSKDGKIIFENEFKNQPTQIINGVFSVKEDEGFSVYKANGNKPELISGLEYLKFVGVLSENLLPVCFPNKRISIVNKDGKEQFELGPIKDKEIIGCGERFIEGMLWISTDDNKEGFVNTSGECVIKPVYKSVGIFRNGRTIALKDSIWSVINKKGDLIFSFKHGFAPIPGVWSYNKYNQICMKDSEDRFYLFDAKGEMSKLSTKIKEVIQYSDKYIIYTSESGEKGMMTIDGEIIIRPKYKELSFGKKGELIASNKDKEWKLLDYSGNLKSEVDFAKVNFIKGFGYISGDNSSYTIMNNDGQPIDKNLDFVDYSTNVWSGVNRSCYIPSEKIIKTVMDMITPAGVGKYKFGESMQNIAVAQGLTVKDVNEKNDISIIFDLSGSYNIVISAWSKYYISYNDFNFSTYSWSPAWNPNSKIEAFIINVNTYNLWEGGVNDFVEVLKQKGYKEERREISTEGPVVLLSNNNLSFFCRKVNDGTLSLIYGKDFSNEFKDRVFEDLNGKSQPAAEEAAAMPE